VEQQIDRISRQLDANDRRKDLSTGQRAAASSNRLVALQLLPPPIDELTPGNRRRP
jgi:hypothetical protein